MAPLPPAGSTRSARCCLLPHVCRQLQPPKKGDARTRSESVDGRGTWPGRGRGCICITACMIRLIELRVTQSARRAEGRRWWLLEGRRGDGGRTRGGLRDDGEPVSGQLQRVCTVTASRSSLHAPWRARDNLRELQQLQMQPGHGQPAAGHCQCACACAAGAARYGGKSRPARLKNVAAMFAGGV